MKEDNQAVIKALNMYGRVPEMWELLEEIERLNNIMTELEIELYTKYHEHKDSECEELYARAQEDKEILDYIKELKEPKE